MRHYYTEHEPTGPRLGVSCSDCTTAEGISMSEQDRAVEARRGANTVRERSYWHAVGEYLLSFPRGMGSRNLRNPDIGTRFVPGLFTLHWPREARAAHFQRYYR